MFVMSFNHIFSQHISVAFAAIFRVKLLPEYKSTMWIVVSSLHNYPYLKPCNNFTMKMAA